MLQLHTIDWIVIGVYLAFALAVGIYVRKKAGTDKEHYFIAGGTLPWWWTGSSIAATMFAADTPLVVTGVVAERGLSGNWLWLSWIGVHAAAFVFFAAQWNRTGTVTDSELIELRYSGREGRWLRIFRSLLYGVGYNCIILAWVLRAMVKITTPFFHWEQWFPGFMTWFASVWPAGTPLGTPSEAVTILALVALVGLYSTLGGINGVVVTDLVQLTIALVGSYWLAYNAWTAVGGQQELLQQLQTMYGSGHQFLNLLPSTESGWLATEVGVGAFAFGAYLIVQSYANVPADGGGFFMQRINTSRSPEDARSASLLFIVLQYVLRVWPWFVVALAAVVLIPIGGEETALDGAASVVADDREMAYPVLMGYLLSPGILGLLVTSLLAAFMSTIDTHINWGASYVVNDLFLAVYPGASDETQIRVARISVVGFAVLAVIVSTQFQSIATAWRLVAALGAALGVPTALRWLWWRINASAEIGAMVAGLGTAGALAAFTSVPYELRLVYIALASVAGTAAGMWWGSPTDPRRLWQFIEKAEPKGFWPDRPWQEGARQVAYDLVRWVAVVGGVIAWLYAAHQVLFFSRWLVGVGLAAAGSAGLWWSIRIPEFGESEEEEEASVPVGSG